MLDVAALGFLCLPERVDRLLRADAPKDNRTDIFATLPGHRLDFKIEFYGTQFDGGLVGKSMHAEMLFIAKNPVNVRGRLVEDVDRLADYLIDRNREMLLQGLERFERGPVQVAQNQFPVAKHHIAGQRIQRKFKAAIGARLIAAFDGLLSIQGKGRRLRVAM
jgi:hypothetical protein